MFGWGKDQLGSSPDDEDDYRDHLRTGETVCSHLGPCGPECSGYEAPQR